MIHFEILVFTCTKCVLILWIMYFYVQARALYPYVPQEEDELQMQAGEQLFALGLSQPEWLVVVRAGTHAPAQIGLVPEVYVQIT